jgi:hypothetical protein
VLLEAGLTVQVSVPPNPELAPWIGGSKVSSAPGMMDHWVYKEDYDECGADDEPHPTPRTPLTHSLTTTHTTNHNCRPATALGEAGDGCGMVRRCCFAFIGRADYFDVRCPPPF